MERRASTKGVFYKSYLPEFNGPCIEVITRATGESEVHVLFISPKQYEDFKK